MRRLLTFRPWKIFLLTAGLPLAAILICLAIIILGLYFSFLEPPADSEWSTWIIVTSWLTGLIIMQAWAGTVGINLQRYTSSPPWLKWTQTIAIFIAFAMLLFFVGVAIYSALQPAIKVQGPAQEGFKTFNSDQRMTLIWLILGALWVLPRLTVYAVNAWLLVSAEGHKRWFSTFILFVLWPIGLWFLQPRIRKIFQAPEERDIAEHLI